MRYGRWTSKQLSSMDILRRMYTLYNLKVLSAQEMLVRCPNFKGPFYGLKQASRSWNKRLDEVIKGFGFITNEEESCVYKKLSGSARAFLVLYVDDILLIGNDKNF